MLPKDKKAVSLMMSYVLLIVIVLALGALTFSWIKTKIPTEEEKCPADLSLIIWDYNCSSQVLELTVQNKGLFDIDGYYIRGESNERIVELEATDNPGQEGRVRFLNGKLESGEKSVQFFDYSKYGNLSKIEIQPFIIRNKKLILCSDISRQEVSC